MPFKNGSIFHLLAICFLVTSSLNSSFAQNHEYCGFEHKRQLFLQNLTNQSNAYKAESTDALDLFLDIGKVLPKRHIPTGLTKYYVGEYRSYQDAIVFRDNLIDKGLVDCFIVGEFKNNIITSQEALNLLGK